jgi:hypothetical protein
MAAKRHFKAGVRVFLKLALGRFTFFSRNSIFFKKAGELFFFEVYAPQTKISQAPLGPVGLSWKIGTSGSFYTARVKRVSTG